MYLYVKYVYKMKKRKIELTEKLIRDTLIEAINEEYQVNEDFRNFINASKKGLLGLGLAATMTSCGDGMFNYNQPTNPTQTEMSYADQQYDKFDWSLITDEQNQGFIYEMYSGCASSGSRVIACIIQKDKYCWRYYVPENIKQEMYKKYNNGEVVDIRDFEPFNGWRGN